MGDSGAIGTAQQVIDEAIRARVFPAAVAEVGDRSRVLWRQPFGRLTFDESSAPADERTIFDLASLAKPVATTSVVLDLTMTGILDLSDRVGTFFDEWRGDDREDVTIQDLLEHASGLASRLVDTAPEIRREFEHEICTMRLEYPPRTRSLYSDLGFLLLGFLAADRGGAPLGAQFDRIARSVTTGLLAFAVPQERRHEAAPTLPLDEDVRRGRVLQAEVHDNYAAALGGVAGHAGLFGTAPALGDFARVVLRASAGDKSLPPPFTPALVARARRRSTVPGSSRALGWDTMLPTSSCGTEMSPAAFGHVGFTGTSLWIDPVRDRYFMLLTNRAFAASSSDAMQSVRRSFHNALAHL